MVRGTKVPPFGTLYPLTSCETARFEVTASSILLKSKSNTVTTDPNQIQWSTRGLIAKCFYESNGSLDFVLISGFCNVKWMGVFDSSAAGQ